MFPYIENTELLHDSRVGVVIIFGVMFLGQADGLDVDQDDEGCAEDPVGHVAHHVVKVGEQVQRLGAPEKM